MLYVIGKEIDTFTYVGPWHDNSKPTNQLTQIWLGRRFRDLGRKAANPPNR